MLVVNKKQVKTFDDLMRLPNLFHVILGMKPFTEGIITKRNGIRKILLYTGLISGSIYLISQLTYLVSAFSSFTSLLELTAAASTTGEFFVAFCKTLTIQWNKHTLKKLINELIELFPKDKKSQMEYDMIKIERNMLKVLIPFGALYIILAWTFILVPVFQSSIEYFFITGKYVKYFPTIIWCPYDTNAWTNYIFTYVFVSYNANLCVLAIIAADVLLCALVTQIIMHFDYIARSLKCFVHKGGKHDYETLIKYVKYQSKILLLTDYVNVVFSSSILITFIASSIVICLTGFQVSVGATKIELFKFFIFLVTVLTEVIVICHYGTRLIESSENIGHVAYNLEWTSANLQYKKILVLVIQRAQKPAYLKATTFPPISLATFNKVVAMSYQFFALLKTTYSQ